MIPNSSIFSIENYGGDPTPPGPHRAPTGPPPGPHRAPTVLI